MCVKTRAAICDARYAGQPQFLSGAVRAMKQQITTLFASGVLALGFDRHSNRRTV
jgi:hypothetical protein